MCLTFVRHPFGDDGDKLSSVGSKIKTEKLKSLHACDTAGLHVAGPLWGLKMFWSNVLSECTKGVLRTPAGDSQ